MKLRLGRSMGVVACALMALTGCHRGLPDGDSSEHSGVDDTAAHSDDSADTGAAEDAPRCAATEVEPNDQSDQAQLVALEARACGSLTDGADIDQWAIHLPDDAWLSIPVAAMSIGSKADVGMFLLGGPDEIGIQREGFGEDPDPVLLIPAKAGDYRVQLHATGGSSGATAGRDNRYEFRASIAKPPADADVAVPAESSFAEPIVVANGATGPDGRVALGVLSTKFQQDYLAVSVPDGNFLVRFEVIADALGSPLDAILYQYDAGGNMLLSVDDGVHGTELDPVLEVHTWQADTLVVGVASADHLYGPGRWYALRITVSPE